MGVALYILIISYFYLSAFDLLGCPGGAEVKASACNVGDLGSISESGRSPGERNSYPYQFSCLENSLDRGYSPLGHKESGTTE